MSNQRKLRLTQVVLSLGAGGTERLVIELCKALEPVADLQVLCLDELGQWAEELEDVGVRVTKLGREPGFDRKLIGKVAHQLKAHGSDIVHCHHYTPFIYGALGSLCSTRARVVYTEHGRLSEAPWTVKRKLANALFGRLPGRFFAVSENLREHMVDGGMPAHKVGVIYNGITPGPIASDGVRTAARKSMGVGPDAFVLGTVARLDPVKDLPTLLEGFLKLRCWARGTALDPWLVVVGDGVERTKLEAMAEDKALTDRVVFLGHRNDARALIAGFDVYVNCSITEGVSVTILEAMAAGVPLVVTGVGGTPEVVAHELTGLVVPARDPDALSASCQRVVQDKTFAATITQAARARLEERFATHTMLESYLKVYRAAR